MITKNFKQYFKLKKCSIILLKSLQNEKQKLICLMTVHSLKIPLKSFCFQLE